MLTKILLGVQLIDAIPGVFRFLRNVNRMLFFVAAYLWIMLFPLVAMWYTYRLLTWPFRNAVNTKERSNYLDRRPREYRQLASR